MTYEEVKNIIEEQKYYKQTEASYLVTDEEIKQYEDIMEAYDVVIQMLGQEEEVLNMLTVKERVYAELEPYKDFSKHKDLIAICVCGEYFHEADEDVDFEELVVVIDKEWLFNDMKKNGIKNPIDYLENEYTSEDSYDWFQRANLEGKICCVDFN